MVHPAVTHSHCLLIVLPLKNDVIVSNGNVGIGTSAPTEKLHVNGNILLAGENINSTTTMRLNALSSMVFMIDYSNDAMMDTNTFNWRKYGATADMMSLRESDNRLTVSGAIYNASGVVTGSDDRIKSDEVFISNGLQTLKKLRPQNYTKWSTMDYVDNDKATSLYESGLIAQEIYVDAPEL
jgi:hypothetical protein